MSDSTARTTATLPAIRAPRGASLSCKGWQQEAVLRMLMNSLDPEVAEVPLQLIVHAGQKAARDWESYDAIVAALRVLESAQTLLVRAGESDGVFPTSAATPRVVIAESDAASWLYTGTQSALHSAYLIFGAAAQKHFGGTLAGKLIVSGGMGGTGGALALAAAWHGAAYLGIDADAEHIKRRLKGGYCDVLVNNLDEAMRILKNAVRKREPASVGLTGNCAELLPALAERGIVPDLLTDQTPAHDLYAYLPSGLDLAAAPDLRQRDANEYRRRSLDSIAAQVRAMLELQRLGSVVFEFGNGLRARAIEAGVPDACNIPDACAEYLLPLAREGRAPLLWVALSGETADIRRLDDALLQELPADEPLAHWISLMRRRGRFEGLPARTVWLGKEQRMRFGARINKLVASGELKAPVALGYGIDRTSLVSKNAAGDALRDGSDATTTSPDWPDSISNALLHAPGASLVAMSSSGDQTVYSAMTVADGTPEAAARIESLIEARCAIRNPQFRTETAK